MEQLDQFKKIFWDAFHRPKLNTDKYVELWNSLEPVNDQVAGPFYSIYTNGHCEYIFRDKDRFPQIKDADDFLDYCTEVIKKYQEEVTNVIPQTDEEKSDKQVLLYQVDMKMELANLAYQIEKDRLNLPGKG
jgi:hypothetical protein